MLANQIISSATVGETLAVARWGVGVNSQILDLGEIEYGACWELQKQLAEQVERGEIPDHLLLLEHPHVITLGRKSTSASNIVAAGNIPTVQVERGGDVTYHGPGQLVGYPILSGHHDVPHYLRSLEGVIIDLIRTYDLPADRRTGYTGVWVGDRKIASIGVAVKNGVTRHGFALNITTDLSYFNRINPCGLQSEVMTSLAVLLGETETHAGFPIKSGMTGSSESFPLNPSWEGNEPLCYEHHDEQMQELRGDVITRLIPIFTRVFWS